MTTIETPLGKMKGVSTDDGLAFRGIRYAEAPVGDLRFRPPVSVSPWSGTFDATPGRPPALFPPSDAVSSCVLRRSERSI